MLMNRVTFTDRLTLTLIQRTQVINIVLMKYTAHIIALKKHLISFNRSDIINSFEFRKKRVLCNLIHCFRRNVGWCPSLG